MLGTVYASLVLFVAAVTLVRGFRQVRMATNSVNRWVKPAVRRYELYTEPIAFLFIIDPADQTGLSVNLIEPVANLLNTMQVPFMICDIREDEAMAREYSFPTVPVLICLTRGVPQMYVRAEQYGEKLPFDRIRTFVNRAVEEFAS